MAESKKAAAARRRKKIARRRRKQRQKRILIAIALVCLIALIGMLIISGIARKNRAQQSPAATAIPTAEPTAIVTLAPTLIPTAAPTAEPTSAPTETPTIAPTEAPTVEPTPEKVTIKITAAGDCTLGGDVPSGRDENFASYFDKYGADYFFQNVRAVFENDDFTIVISKARFRPARTSAAGGSSTSAEDPNTSRF